MTLFQAAVTWIGDLVSAVILLGLFWRRHFRAAAAFTAYIATLLVAEVLVAAWPERFWTLRFWGLTDIVFGALKIAVAIETGYWIFRAFPGAAQSARGIALVLLALTFLTILALPNEVGRDDAGFTIGSIRPRLAVGAAWLFTVLAALAEWYRVPLRPMHRAIVYGLGLQLVVFGAVLKAIVTYGWSQPLVTLEPVSFVCILGWWAWRAWQPDRAPDDVDPALVARLQPWRAS
jgi:hypothetical protein